MVDILRLVGDLQARRAHSKMHAIHVNLAGEWLSLVRLGHVRVLVLEQWHLDLNFLLASALID